MPFKSRQQERWAFATGQPFAKRWGDMTKGKKLPDKAKPKNPKRVIRRSGRR